MRTVLISSYIIKNSEQCEVRTARDACSWKVLVVKSEDGKIQAKLERTERSWEEPIEVGMNRARSEKPNEVGKFLLKLESFAAVEKL